LHRPFGMAAAWHGLPVRLDRAPQRGAAFALASASRRAWTRHIGSRSTGSLLIFDHPPASAPPSLHLPRRLPRPLTGKASSFSEELLARPVCAAEPSYHSPSYRPHYEGSRDPAQWATGACRAGPNKSTEGGEIGQPSPSYSSPALSGAFFEMPMSRFPLTIY